MPIYWHLQLYGLRAIVSCALMICPDMYPRTLGPNSPRAWVYISGKSLVPMIQLLNTLLKYNFSCKRGQKCPLHFSTFQEQIEFCKNGQISLGRWQLKFGSDHYVKWLFQKMYFVVSLFHLQILLNHCGETNKLNFWEVSLMINYKHSDEKLTKKNKQINKYKEQYKFKPDSSWWRY